MRDKLKAETQTKCKNGSRVYLRVLKRQICRRVGSLPLRGERVLVSVLLLLCARKLRMPHYGVRGSIPMKYTDELECRWGFSACDVCEDPRMSTYGAQHTHDHLGLLDMVEEVRLRCIMRVGVMSMQPCWVGTGRPGILVVCGSGVSLSASLLSYSLLSPCHFHRSLGLLSSICISIFLLVFLIQI